MPCDTISETEVEFGHQTDGELLKKALSSLGFQVQTNTIGFTFVNSNTYEVGRFANGKFSFTQRSTEVNALKRAYSEQVVKSQVARFGWKLKEEKREGKQAKFLVRKQVL